MALTLQITFPDGSRLPVSDAVILGRADFKGFAPDDELNLVSSKQFRIFREGNIFYIEDGIVGEQSSNGTMLNGQDIRPLGKQALRTGDVVSLADVLVVNISIQ